MSPILTASGFGRRHRTTTAGSHDPTDSSETSRCHSSSSNGRKPSQSSSRLDDWSDGFTGIVDLDRRMRDLAMAEQGLSNLDGNDQLDVYELYSPQAPSWIEQQHSRRKSSSDARSGSASQSSLATGRSNASFTREPSVSSTAATSRFSPDSRAHSSLLSKRRSSAANTVWSLDSAHSPLRLAPLPASSSAFGSYRLTDATTLSSQPRLSTTLSSPSWSSLDENDPSTPLATAARQLEPITPGTAAAATWTDPSAPGYFPAGLATDSKRKGFSLRMKAARAPLPRLMSGEVVSWPAAASERNFEDALLDKHAARPDALRLALDVSSDPIDGRCHHDRSTAPSSSAYALKRSAQSLALSFRFKMLRAKRKVTRTGQDAAELFVPGYASQKSSLEATSLSN